MLQGNTAVVGLVDKLSNLLVIYIKTDALAHDLFFYHQQVHKYAGTPTACRLSRQPEDDGMDDEEATRAASAC